MSDRALMDLPLLGDEDQSLPSAKLAAFADPWPGAVALYREGAGGVIFSGLAQTKSVIGRLESALAPGFSGRFDKRPARIRLSFGALSSKSEEEVFAGANALGVETAAGWEVLQFLSAALGPDGAWTLTGLLRGQAGTEDCAAAGGAIGARCVVLSLALSDIAWPRDLAGQSAQWQAGPEQDLPDTENFTTKALTLSARALKPLSPVHLGAEVQAGGVRLCWIRRTRLGGDGWDGEVPLAESFERYRVFIYDAALQKRAFDVSPPFDADADARPNALYTDAMIAEDFGAAVPPSAAFEVCQLSDAAGEGRRARRGLR